MTHRFTQLLVLFFVTLLIIVAVWYQALNEGFFQTKVLSPYGGYYGFGMSGNTATVPKSSVRPQDLKANKPQFSQKQGGLLVHKYLIPFSKITVLDALQVPLYVPTFSTSVRWIPDPKNISSVVIADKLSTRTTFIAPDKSGSLLFNLEVKDSSGVYKKVAKYIFTVVSPLEYKADVNKDGKYDFSHDLVYLLQNWDLFGNDSTLVLSLILSRLEQSPAITK